MKTILFWLPRLFALAFGIALGIFAIEVFGMPAPYWEKIGGFIIHSIPSLAILLVTIFTWKKPFWGSLLFILIFVIFTLYFRTFTKATSFLVISLPILIIALLYTLDFYNPRKE